MQKENKKCHSNVTNAPKGIGLAQDTFEEGFCNIGHAPETKKPRNEVRSQGQSEPKWYATLSHPKRNPHTKFGISTSYNIGDMLQTGFFLKLRVKVTVT